MVDDDMTWQKAPAGFLAIGLVVSLIFLLFPAPSMTVQILVLAIAVAALGLPHGAIDAYIARRSGLWRSPGGLAAFACAYLFIAFGVIAIWSVLPVLSLVAFLIISAWHFGADAGALNRLERWLFGSLLLSLPACFDPLAVAALFATLSGASARVIPSFLQILAPVSALGVIAMITVFPRLRPRPQRWQDLAVVSALIAFAWLLPPLVYFVLYFCALHSPLHLARVLKLVPRADRFKAVLHTVGFTVITIFCAGLIFIGLSGEASPQQAVLRVLFIGLAALTVPHMLLVDGICREKLAHRR